MQSKGEKKMKMKKKLAYLLVAVLSVSMLAGCGSKGSKSSSSDDSSKSTKKEAKSEKVSVGLSEVLENAAEAATGIESVNISATGEAEMVANAQGQDVTATGSFELTGNATKDDPAFDLKGSAKYDVDMGGQNLSGDYSMEAYAEEEDDKLTVYAQLNDTGWEKSSMEKSEYEEAFAQMESGLDSVKEALSNISEEDFKEVEEYIKLEDKTKSVNGKECYVLTLDVDRDQLIELAEIGQEYSEEYDDEEFEQYLETFKQLEKFDIVISLYFDKDTYLPVKVSADIAMKGEVEGTAIDLKKLSFELTFSVNEGVSVEEVPADAKENAVEADDYDFDDEDYDFEEDAE